MGVRELTYGEAVREAVAEEMRGDPRVLLIGEDVAEACHPSRMLSSPARTGPERRRTARAPSARRHSGNRAGSHQGVDVGGARTTARTMYREMGMTFWLQKAEAKLKD
jgi:hypothetical protein